MNRGRCVKTQVELEGTIGDRIRSVLVVLFVFKVDCIFASRLYSFCDLLIFYSLLFLEIQHPVQAPSPLLSMELVGEIPLDTWEPL